MKMRYGLHLLIALMILFGVTVPIVIFMVLGYRVDLDTLNLIPTGTLTVDSTPKDATVFINGQKQGKTTPATLRYLLPGEYEMTLEKTGYQTFSKRITVQPRQVTVPHTPGVPILLFYEKPTTITETENVLTYIPSVKTLLTSQNGVLALEQNGVIKTLNNRDDYPVEGEIDWSIADNKDQMFIFKAGNELLLLPSATSTVTNISEVLLQQHIKQAAILNTKNLALLTNESKLYLYNIAESTAKLLNAGVTYISTATDSSSLYFSKNNSIYSIDTQQEEPVPLLYVSLTNEEKIQELIPVPGGDIYAIADGALLRVRPDGAQYLLDKVQSAKWYASSQQLLIYNHNSVWIFEPSIQSEPRLAIRLSGPISKPQLASNAKQLFLLYADTIKSVPLDPLLQSQSVDVINLETPVRDFWIGTDAKRIHLLYANGTFETLQVR